MLLYLAVSPEETPSAIRFTRHLAHVAYRIGSANALLRREGLTSQSGILTLSDQNAPEITAPEIPSAAVLRECARRSFSGVLLDFDRPPTPDRTAFVHTLTAQMRAAKLTLYVPEAYALSGAVVLVSTALSGGNLCTRLREARTRYGAIALDLQRLAMEFSLPSPSGEGTPLRQETLKRLLNQEAVNVFFSSALCAKYFTYVRGGQTRFVLFDDAGTLGQKQRLGQDAGALAAFISYPESEDLLSGLFGPAGCGRQR